MSNNHTPSLKEREAQRLAEAEARKNKTARTFTDEEKALRKERVVAAKDALARSVGTKGDHVPPARTALKKFLQNLNEPNQPDEQRFAALLEAPFKAPPKKRDSGRF